MSVLVQKHILICDDDGDLREQLTKAFGKRGYAVTEATSADEALEVVERTVFTHALVDLRMAPRRSGLLVVEALSKRTPTCRTIVYTGFGSIQTAVDAIKLGAKEFVTKPMAFSALFAIVDAQVEPLRASPQPVFPSLEEVTREYTNRVLHEFDGNVTQTAKVLGLHRRSLQRKIKVE
jgi:two-component system response regulator RegA